MLLVNVPSTSPIAYIPNKTSFSYVWLSRDREGQGIAYISHPSTPNDLLNLVDNSSIEIFNSPHTKPVAQLILIENNETWHSLLSNWQSLRSVDYEWNHEAHLIGYEIQLEQIPIGESPILTLYWRPLVEQPFRYILFIQLVNARGEPVAQWTDLSLSHQYTWRTGITPIQHRLWFDPEAKPGPYLIRMGLFSSYDYDERIPVYNSNGEFLGDQVVLGLFYVTKENTNPSIPENHLVANLGNEITLLGYSKLSLDKQASTLRVQLHWQANNKIDQNYTIFVQLLDSQGQLVTGWDSQPLAGQYPTSRWQPGEIIVDNFVLQLPDQLPPDDYRLITGLQAFKSDGESLPDDMVILTQTTISPFQD